MEREKQTTQSSPDVQPLSAQMVGTFYAESAPGSIYRIGSRPPKETPATNSTDRDAHASLSRRERDVLHWLAFGKSGSEIAMILDISVCTVRLHIRNLVRKLEASNIPHAIARAFKTKVLSL